MRPRITLQTLSRGDGLLGMRPSGSFGPRGGNVTVARIDWLYAAEDGSRWEIPAPATILERRPPDARELRDEEGRPVMRRDVDAEADALDQVWDLGLLPLPPETLQWRGEPGSGMKGPLWTLVQEEAFGDFWAEKLPLLQDAGWSVVVRPGFAHESVAVDAWHLVVNPASGDVIGKEVASRMRGREQGLMPLDQNARSASWMLTLGVEVDGELLDLLPMLAQLLHRDARWLDAGRLAAIDDEALIQLRAPGGRRIDARAGPLKAIVSNMLELLLQPRRRDKGLCLSSWDALRFEHMCQELHASQAARAGPHGRWQMQGEAGLRSLAQRLLGAGSPRVVQAPEGLGVTLRPYQLHGVGWLQYLREQRLAGILADDMGLGKTAQVLAHLLLEKQSGRLDCPALVVLPTSLIFNWQAEGRRIAPALRLLTLHGPERGKAFSRIPDHDVVLTTYPLLWRDLSLLEQQRFHFLILDEAQTVKNPSGRAAGAVRRIRARHRLSITGTPLENHLGELWAQFDFLMPGFLGDARSFVRDWRRPIEVNGQSLRAELLARRVRPFILRRRKDEVAAELPPRAEAVRLVRLQGHQRDLYESVRVAADEQVRGILRRKGFAGAQITILDALLKLRQVCCDPRLLKGMTLQEGTGSAKLDMLSEMLMSLVAEDRRVLVFSQFAEMLDLVAGELTALRLPWLALTGATPANLREQVVAQFQNREVPVLLASLKAGGVGLNLTAADTVIHLDPWWNPAVEEQATARAHRIGQTQPVFVYKLVVEGSIEERMLELQARKGALAESVLGSDGGLSPKFSAEDLRMLMAPLALDDGAGKT